MYERKGTTMLLGSAMAGVFTLGILVPAAAASAAEPERSGPVVMDEMKPGTPIVDGRTGQVSRPDAAGSPLGTVDCGGVAWAPPGAVTWGPESRGKCGLAGFPGYKAGYAFAIAPGSNAHACVQGLGYSSGKGKWYSVGCGSSGRTTVSWGNVLAYQKGKARSQTGLGGFMKWW
ncbi:hypothetical protein BIU97_07490 [Curtobacterium sp. MCBA15_009]|uniref:hypothetical protein n=1 Tax=Curtobacterium sp. MCBA15_009 TaxID=1898737 RepID=UPI0008DE9B53|nr:hypothetical protein [Curtobacterium sp. MCBA15_009]OII11700.1 hypothetical protein BIU97_07490 [Curtobacterium sp. MCBA15_009]